MVNLNNALSQLRSALLNQEEELFYIWLRYINTISDLNLEQYDWCSSYFDKKVDELSLQVEALETKQDDLLARFKSFNSKLEDTETDLDNYIENLKAKRAKMKADHQTYIKKFERKQAISDAHNLIFEAEIQAMEAELEAKNQEEVELIGLELTSVIYNVINNYNEPKNNVVKFGI